MQAKLLSLCLMTLWLGSGHSILRNQTLSSPQVTNWGSWGEWQYCPEGQFVVGMSLKTEYYQGAFSDDSGLNGIKFYCDKIGNNEGTTFITSKEGYSGNWGKDFFCNGVAVGFQLLSEKNLGPFNDDVAADNLRIFCDGKAREGDGESWGSWTAEQRCDSHLAMCGLLTQVEDPNSDDTTLNNIEVMCCPVPDPAVTCTPKDTYDLILECDNTEATSPTTCTYERKVGTSSWNMMSESSYMMSEIYSHIGFTIPGALTGLPANFQGNLGWSVETGYNWTSSSGEIWTEETTITVGVDVPPGIRTKLMQTYGTCDFYSVRANIIKRIDYDTATKKETISYSTFTNKIMNQA